MRTSFNKITGILGLLCFCQISLAAENLAGKWTGKMTLDGSVLKKELNAQLSKVTGERKKAVESRIHMIDESIKVVEKTEIKMDLKKGGKAFVELTRNGKKEPEWCKWKAKGKAIFLNGFSGGGDATMALNGSITNSGKTLVFDMSPYFAGQMKSQGLRPAQKPKLTLTFKKT